MLYSLPMSWQLLQIKCCARKRVISLSLSRRYVLIYPFFMLWYSSREDIRIWQCCTTLNNTRKSTSVVCRQYDVSQPSQASSSVGSRAFSIAGPQVWNQLPIIFSSDGRWCIVTFDFLCHTNTLTYLLTYLQLTTFKHNLKSNIFM